MADDSIVSLHFTKQSHHLGIDRERDISRCLHGLVHPFASYLAKGQLFLSGSELSFEICGFSGGSEKATRYRVSFPSKYPSFCLQSSGKMIIDKLS